MSEINLNAVIKATQTSLDASIPESLQRFEKSQILDIARRILAAKNSNVFNKILGSSDVNQALGLVYERSHRENDLTMDEFSAIEKLVDVALEQSSK